MSLYIIVWLFVCVMSIKEAAALEKKSKPRIAFWASFIILTMMLVLRYGQGTDYFGYSGNYYRISDVTITFPEYEFYGETVHGELGYNLLCNIFRVLHIPFEGFVAVISIAQMGFMLTFYRRYKVDCAFAVLLSIPTLYMTYFMSGLRQGLIIAVFLGVLFPLLENRHYVGYLIGVLICVSFHTVAVVFLLLPVTQKLLRIDILQFLVLIAWLIGILLATPEGQMIVKAAGISSLDFYLSQSNVSVMAAAERLVFLGIISWLYIKLIKNGKCSETFKLAYMCYLVTMALYGGLLWNDLIASRTAAVMRFVEIYLLVYATKQMRRGTRYLVVIFLVAFQSFMFFKNVNTAILEGQYRQGITFINYPYVSIFNEEKISEYRVIPSQYITIS